MSYRRTPIEIESPENIGYDRIRFNLTESSVPDMEFTDLGLQIDRALSYTDHRGAPLLRQYIAEPHFDPRCVLVTPGAAAALFIVATSLLTAGDHVVVLHPNYVTNIETPRAIGCRSDYLRLRFDQKFALDLEELEHLITPDTRLVSLTYPHNPTGAMITESELKAVIDMVESVPCYLLLDETYREMTFEEPLPIAASLSPHVISVSSMSKSYGLPGIRIGWVLTADSELQERFLAAKEQIFICNSVIDEYIAEKVLSEKGNIVSGIRSHIDTNFQVVRKWMHANPWFEFVEPQGGCVCSPRFREHVSLDVKRFYTVLNETYETYVGPGHWFEMDDRYMRIGYGWPQSTELSSGLSCITKAVEELL
ncbi:MAG: pyridoxal phosphate-dependent aminotransferase [Theionarchaea archaeon]|nr:pyridoxal phosphate-dependent aminotransferase [Theionarchaea archaeon]